MNSVELYELFVTNPAVQMLRLRNAGWVLPFLYKVFKEENRPIIEESTLIQLLAETLSTQEEGLEDMEESKIVF